MKKIFTLISLAMMAIGVNAQSSWDVSKLTFEDKEGKKVLKEMSSEENKGVAYNIPEAAHIFPVGTYVSGDPSHGAGIVKAWLDENGAATYALTQTNWIFTAQDKDVTMKAIATPNSDAAENEYWQGYGVNFSSQSNLGLNTDACVIKWTDYVKPKTGNPSLGYYEYYDEKEDGGTSFRTDDNMWSVGCGQIPAKGCYYEFTFAKAGEATIGVFLTKPNANQVVVVEKESKEALPVADLSFEGYCQNNTFKYPTNSEESTDPTYQKFNFRDNYTIDVSSQPGRPLLGYLSFPVEAKTYLLFQPSTQVGFYGFYFEETSGIENVKSLTNNANAAIYNLAGQKVSNDFKGMVIQNGKKFMNK